MSITSLRGSLEKRHSALTGELEHIHANIARIQREVEKLPDFEARIPELEAVIESVKIVLKHAHPDWVPEEMRSYLPSEPAE
jgi:hypothetical protein